MHISTFFPKKTGWTYNCTVGNKFVKLFVIDDAYIFIMIDAL